jgi:hypothetical protein
MGNDLSVVLIDDVASRLVNIGNEAASEIVDVKNEFLTGYISILAQTFETVLWPAEFLRQSLNTMPTVGVCLSLERHLYREGAIPIGDSYSWDEKNCRVIICKPGFKSASDVLFGLTENEFTIEDVCAVSGNTLRHVVERVRSDGRVVKQVNIGIASHRAMKSLIGLSTKMEIGVVYPRLKCIELRNLLLFEPQFEVLNGIVAVSTYSKEIDILGALPFSKADYETAVEMVTNARSRIRKLIPTCWPLQNPPPLVTQNLPGSLL